MTRLLSRYAESIFWLARYVERAENLARILEIQSTFARDGRGGEDWGAVLAINSDQERFAAMHPGGPTAANVLRFYVLDRANPTSILSNLVSARENARVLRPLISTEMWAQLNVFYNRIAALPPSELGEERVARLFATVKEGCDTHSGITAGTFYRDEAWLFYRLGAAIETADQTTRLLDVRLLARDRRASVDASHWMALLRSAASYQAFRRLHPREMRAGEVAVFLLCDPGLPRSVRHCLTVVQDALERLRREHGLKPMASALSWLDELTAALDPRHVRASFVAGGVHVLNDGLQRGLQRLSADLASTFFVHAGRDPAPPPPTPDPPPPPPEPSSASQDQD